MNTGSRKLGELQKGESGWIVAVEDASSEVSRRLLEMGFLEGAPVEVMHVAPFGKDPIAVKVRGALIALRRSEANRVRIVSRKGLS